MPAIPPEPDDPRSDDFLVEAVNRGDVAAFEALYRRYRNWVVRLAYRLTGNHDDALDVLQETFTYFLRKFPGFRLEAKLTTFLYPAVKHLAIAARERSRRHAPQGEECEAEARDPAASDSPDPEASREALDHLLRALPESQREVLLLRFVDDFSLGEIATALEIPAGTVKSRLHNALARLREDPATRRYFEG